MYARSNDGAETVTALGPTFFGAPHRYRIDWDTTSVTYYIDGIALATHAVSIAGPMRPIAASDFQPFGGNVTIDWIRMGPYPASGSFLSRVFDAVTDVDWHYASWSAVTPPGTSAAISVRTGTAAQDGNVNWSAFTPIGAPGAISATGRYIQYRADLATSDPWNTPELTDIILTTGHAPVAVDDSATTPADTAYVFPPTGSLSLTANDTDADVPTLLRVAAVTPPAHGTAILTGNGMVVYTPAPGFTGEDSFTYLLSDGLLTSTATVSMHVGNAPPDAEPQAVTTNEDTPVNISLTASDADGDTLTVIIVTPPQHGTLGGTFPNLTYTPNANFNGSDSFTYKVSDGRGGESNPTTVTITITSVNDAPVAVADIATTDEDTPVQIPVLANDTDADAGDTKSLASVTQGAHGSVTMNGDGTVTYTPAPNFNGTDMFTYIAKDAAGTLSGSATVTVTVGAVNDAPVAVNDAKTTAEDTPLTFAASQLTANDTDVDGDTLTVTAVSGASNGTVVLNAGTITFTPTANVNGRAASATRSVTATAARRRARWWSRSRRSTMRRWRSTTRRRRRKTRR